jgi:hypothetical protein
MRFRTLGVLVSLSIAAAVSGARADEPCRESEIRDLALRALNYPRMTTEEKLNAIDEIEQYGYQDCVCGIEKRSCGSIAIESLGYVIRSKKQAPPSAERDRLMTAAMNDLLDIASFHRLFQPYSEAIDAIDEAVQASLFISSSTSAGIHYSAGLDTKTVRALPNGYLKMMHARVSEISDRESIPQISQQAFVADLFLNSLERFLAGKNLEIESAIASYLAGPRTMVRIALTPKGKE